MSRSTPKSSQPRRGLARTIAGISMIGAFMFGVAGTPAQAKPVTEPHIVGVSAATGVSMPVFKFGGLDVINGNNNGRELHVCKDWGWPSGVWHAKTCKSDGTNGEVQRLRPGQKSSQGDTDGIHVPKGYRLERKVPRRDGTYWRVERGCVTDSKEWTKVQPSKPFGNVEWFRIVKC